MLSIKAFLMLPPRIMYIENKSARPPGQSGVRGPARIGRVRFSKSGKSVYYNERTFRSLNGAGYKTNHYDLESGEQYWISGPRKDGNDGLYGYRPTPIDEDVREEYWIHVRNLPDKKDQKFT